MFAAHSANPHLAAAAAADPYNVSNTLHNFQTSQVNDKKLDRFYYYVKHVLYRKLI